MKRGECTLWCTQFVKNLEHLEAFGEHVRNNNFSFKGIAKLA